MLKEILMQRNSTYSLDIHRDYMSANVALAFGFVLINLCKIILNLRFLPFCNLFETNLIKQLQNFVFIKITRKVL